MSENDEHELMAFLLWMTIVHDGIDQATAYQWVYGEGEA